MAVLPAESQPGHAQQTDRQAADKGGGVACSASSGRAGLTPGAPTWRGWRRSASRRRPASSRRTAYRTLRRPTISTVSPACSDEEAWHAPGPGAPESGRTCLLPRAWRRWLMAATRVRLTPPSAMRRALVRTAGGCCERRSALCETKISPCAAAQACFNERMVSHVSALRPVLHQHLTGPKARLTTSVRASGPMRAGRPAGAAEPGGCDCAALGLAAAYFTVSPVWRERGALTRAHTAAHADGCWKFRDAFI